MNRRRFFGRMFGAIAAAVAAPFVPAPPVTLGLSKPAPLNDISQIVAQAWEKVSRERPQANVASIFSSIPVRTVDGRWFGQEDDIYFLDPKHGPMRLCGDTLTLPNGEPVDLLRDFSRDDGQ